MKRKDFPSYTNTQISHLIDEHIHSKRDRMILKLIFIDNETYETVAEVKEIDVTPRQVSNIVSKCMETLSKYLR